MNAPRVEMEIVQGNEAWGRVVIELDPQKAPETVANFLKYVDAKFFDGVIFHRVIPHFMIQGGGYASIGVAKRGENPPIKNEAKTGLKNERGVIAMARTNDPHSATSQFFINVANNGMLDHPGSDGWGYCGFGRVVEGMEVVDRIKDVETVRNPQMGEDSQPKDPPAIKSARRAAVK
jgi:peptidyl-prolyl cis-trans isomerase B (cyclophilin B)